MSITVHASKHPLRDDWVEASVEAGQTIREICGDVPVHAWINGREVSAVFIERARIKDGATLIVRPAPEGGDILKVVLTIGVAIASAYTAGAVGAAYGAAWGAAAGAAVGIAGSLLVNTLIPPATPQMTGGTGGSFNRLNALTGQSNQIAQFQPIPCLYGEFRYFPPVPMTAQPYTELAGNDQYLRMKLCLGYGPIEIDGHIVGAGYAKLTEETAIGDAIQIDNTAIGEYDEVSYEIGAPDQMTLYTDQIIETNPAWTTNEADAVGNIDRKADPQWINDGQATIRTTDTDAEEIAVDIYAQLYCIDKDGDTKTAKIDWLMEYRASGSTDAWTAEPFTQVSNQRETSRVSHRVTVAKGQYDVRLTRVRTFFHDFEGGALAQATWQVLRTIRHRPSFTVPDTVVMDLRIKATDQLNGTIQKLSVLGTRVLPVWDTDTQQWVMQATRAHAWALADILTGAANRRPIDRSDLNVAQLVAWAAETEAAGRRYDAVFDDNATVLSRLQEVVAAGRAAWHIDSDTRVSVILDTAQSMPKMVISPRNSFGYAYTLSAFKPPEALRVRYVSADTWENTERVVYDDGYGAVDDPGSGIKGAQIYDTVDAKGCTSSDQAWKYGRYHLASMRLRGIEKHQFSQDVQHLRYNRGDLLALAHDVIEVGLGWGRVRSVQANDSGDITAVTVDEFLQMPDANAAYGIKIQRQDGSVIVVGVANDSPGAHSLTLSTPTADINVDDHLVFGVVGKITTDVKVSTITPQGDLQAQIVCEPDAPNILDAETGDIPLPETDITVPPDVANLPPNAPTIGAIASDESVALRNDDGSLAYRVQINVVANSGRVATDHIVVQIREADAVRWRTTTAVDGAAYFAEVYPGDALDIRARAVSANGTASAWVYYYDYTVTGRIPQPPTSLKLTPHTFTVDIDPQGGLPSSKYEFFRSGEPLAPADIETNATRLNGQPASVWTDSGLTPETTYYYHARTRTIYGASVFTSQQVTTRNDPLPALKNFSQDINASKLAGTLFAPIPLITGNGAGSVNARIQSAQGDTQQQVDQLRAQLGGDTLATELGFDTGDPGDTATEPAGWRYHTDDASVQTGYVDPLDGSHAAYGALTGTVGNWSLGKCFELAGDETEISGSMQVAVAEGQVFVMCRFYARDDFLLQTIQGEPLTADGTLDYAFPVCPTSAYYEIILVAGSDAYADTIPNWFDGYNPAVPIGGFQAGDSIDKPLLEYS